MKIADRLRDWMPGGTVANDYAGRDAMREAADALDALEKALEGMLDCYLDVDGSDGALETAAKEQARAALAKLRGEA